MNKNEKLIIQHILKDYTENEKFALSDAGAYYAKVNFKFS